MNAELLRKILTYNEVTGIFTWNVKTSRRIRVGDTAGYRGEYVFIRIHDELYRAHRLAWLYINGEWPSEDVDHIDKNPYNNAISNLREATDSQNLFNTSIRSDNTSGVKGVSFSARDNVWRAYVNSGGKQKNLGCFKTKAEAVVARLLGEAQHEHSAYLA